MRKPIPPWLQDALIALNRYQCCVCKKNGVQLHHLDGNHSNNVPENIAVLCLDHHDNAEQAKSWTGMSKALSSEAIRLLKTNTERQNAIELGHASAEAFLATKGSHSDQLPKPQLYASTFNDFQEWGKIRESIAAFAGASNKAYHFQCGILENKIVALGRCGIPSHDVYQIPSNAWIKQSDNFVVPLDKQILAGFPLATYGYVSTEKQTNADRRASEVLRKKDIYEAYGIHLEFTINGGYHWPEGIKEYELSTWLQYIALLRHHFNLLDEYAVHYSEIAREWRRIKSMNTSPKDWTVSFVDGNLCTKIDQIIPLIRGKSIVLGDILRVSVKQVLRKELEEVLDLVASPTSVDDFWNGLVESVKAAIASIVNPERAKHAMLFPSPVLNMRLITAIHENKFQVSSDLITSTGPNGEEAISPSEEDGRCNIRAEFIDYFTIDVYPNERPKDILAQMEMFKSMDLPEVIRKFRKPFPP